jgi:hypothetical protein
VCLHPPNHQHRNPGTCQWLVLRIAQIGQQTSDQNWRSAYNGRSYQSLNGIEAVSERAGTVMPPIPALTASMKRRRKHASGSSGDLLPPSPPATHPWMLMAATKRIPQDQTTAKVTFCR